MLYKQNNILTANEYNVSSNSRNTDQQMLHNVAGHNFMASKCPSNGFVVANFPPFHINMLFRKINPFLNKSIRERRKLLIPDRQNTLSKWKTSSAVG